MEIMIVAETAVELKIVIVHTILYTSVPFNKMMIQYTTAVGTFFFKLNRTHFFLNYIYTRLKTNRNRELARGTN